MRAIITYTTATHGKTQAKYYYNQLEKQVLQLLDYPSLGISKYDIHPDSRMLTCGEHAVFYRLKGDVVEVLRVLHKKMNYTDHI